MAVISRPLFTEPNYMVALAKILVGHCMPLFCDGFAEDFRKTSGILLVECANSVAEMEDALKKNAFDIVFLYDKMDPSGADILIKKIKQDALKTKIVLLTMSRDTAYIKECLIYDIRGIISCNSNSNTFKNAIVTVLNEKIFICPELTELIVGRGLSNEKNTNSDEALLDLDEKLSEFFHLKSKGHSLETISEKMGVAQSTVKRYGSQLLHKLREKGYNNITDYLAKKGN
jgi:DNA-binding NarL/FixJ family response regulator